MKITNVVTREHKTKDGRSFKVTFCDIDGVRHQLVKLPNGNYLALTREEKERYYKMLTLLERRKKQ